MKKKIIIGVIAAVVLVCGGFAVYLNSEGYEYKATHLPANTFINGVDCSELTEKEAISELTNAWNKKSFTVTRNGKKVAKFPLKELEYEIDGDIEEFIGTNFFSVLSNHSGSDKKEHKISMKIKDTAALNKKIIKDKFLLIPYKVMTKDAYVDMSDTKFKLVKEVYGDNVDKEKVAKKIDSLIEKGEFKFEFEPKKYIDKPELKLGDKALKEEQKFDKENYSQKFVYEKYNGEYRIMPKDIKKMRPVDANGKATIDKKAIKKFMNDTLAWQVNTQYFDRKFKSTDQGTITVYGGTYGYVLDKDKEAKKLAEDLEANKDFTRKPVFSQTPYYTGKDKKDGRGDIGDSYAEVSIGSQSLWLYIKGKRVMSTSVTTGRSGNDTEKGVYYIEYKQKGATLTGADYSSPVTYWMPFNGNQGCHDAPWRGDFGSAGYTSSGSHGCVNMPYYAAAEMFSKVEKGFPVVVH